MPPEDSSRDPRIYLAAERTFLAWIRTSLALMAFGFVVSRFGLFLRVLESSTGQSISAPSVLSLPLGIFLVLLGVLADVFAAWRHIRYIRALNQGLPTSASPTTLAIVLAVILAVLGLLLAFYLGNTTKSRQPPPNSLSKDHISMKFTHEPIPHFRTAHAKPSGCFPAMIFPVISNVFRSITTT